MLVFFIGITRLSTEEIKSTWIGIPGMDANLHEHDLNAVSVLSFSSSSASSASFASPA